MSSNRLVNELVKTFLFLAITFWAVYCLQAHYERVANQSMLVDRHQPGVCPLYTDELKGVFDVDLSAIPDMDAISHSVKNLDKGGFHTPDGCVPREKLAIIIPYRDRKDNLALLLKHLHPLLQRQGRYYRVFVVEQYGDDIFNKGRIMNIGVSEAMKVDNFDCFIFHDVDLIPENDLNIYECAAEPRHLCPSIDEMRYNLMYYNLVGGVLALNRQQLSKTNGFSNLYWGWGAEDDDMSMRILNSGYKITRPPSHIGRYKMILHRKRTRALNRFHLLNYWTRYEDDGLNSLSKHNFTVNVSNSSVLFTKFMVDIGPSKIEQIDTENLQDGNFKFF
jgi:beta-1,4-galactosyltransferase 1